MRWYQAETRYVLWISFDTKDLVKNMSCHVMIIYQYGIDMMSYKRTSFRGYVQGYHNMAGHVFSMLYNSFKCLPSLNIMTNWLVFLEDEGLYTTYIQSMQKNIRISRL